MDATKVNVNDKEEIKVFIINNVEIRIINLSLGNYVDVNAVLKQDNNFISSQNFRIQGEEYTNWGNDDTYLENLILQKLGLTRKE
jgi:hypothetical protein